jgi:hypothetical protein
MKSTIIFGAEAKIINGLYSIFQNRGFWGNFPQTRQRNRFDLEHCNCKYPWAIHLLWMQM